MKIRPLQPASLTSPPSRNRTRTDRINLITRKKELGKLFYTRRRGRAWRIRNWGGNLTRLGVEGRLQPKLPARGHAASNCFATRDPAPKLGRDRRQVIPAIYVRSLDQRTRRLFRRAVAYLNLAKKSRQSPTASMPSPSTSACHP